MSKFFTLYNVVVFAKVLLINALLVLARFWHGVLQKKFLFMKRILAIITVLSSAFFVSAQTMTMEECMEYAIKHSVSVNKQHNALDDAKMDYRQSVASLFPSVSAGVSAATNLGRSINPETNSYTTVSTFSNSYSLSASMPLFAGLRYVNGIRASKVARQRGHSELQIARDNVAMEVMRAYIDVIYYEGTVAIAKEHLSASRDILHQAQKLYVLGRKSAAEVAEVASQEANYDYLLIEQQNNLAMARIKLRDVMNYPQDAQLEVVAFAVGDFVPQPIPETELVSYALSNNVQVQLSELAVKERKIHYLKAKGGWFPTISLSAGINTNYFTGFGNRMAYPGFLSQFKNNMGGYVGLSMSIPIFSNLGQKASVNASRNALRNAELEMAAIRSAVESEVVQACRQMEGYGKQYELAKKKVEASQLAYDGVAARFAKGLVTAIDLQSASTTLLQAKSDRLRSLLQYHIEARIVEYYYGRPFVAVE